MSSNESGVFMPQLPWPRHPPGLCSTVASWFSDRECFLAVDQAARRACAPLTLAMGAVIAIATAVRIASEEALLRVEFPEYEDYARRTKRLVPFLF